MFISDKDIDKLDYINEFNNRGNQLQNLVIKISGNKSIKDELDLDSLIDLKIIGNQNILNFIKLPALEILSIDNNPQISLSMNLL